MRLRDLLESMVPREKLGEPGFTKLHIDCRVALGLPNGGYAADLTSEQKLELADRATQVNRKLRGES